MRFGLIIFIALILSVPAIENVLAQAEKKTNHWLAEKVGHQARVGVDIQLIRKNLEGQFFSSDLDGNGISSTDRKLESDLAETGVRKRKLHRWLRWDLDGDGVVTRAELQRGMTKAASKPIRINGVTVPTNEAQQRTNLDKLVEHALRWDLNQDGSISFSEALQIANRDVKQYRSGMARRRHGRWTIDVLRELDGNGDKTVTYKEFSKELEAILMKLDKNEDGFVDNEERVSFKKWLRVFQGQR